VVRNLWVVTPNVYFWHFVVVNLDYRSVVSLHCGIYNNEISKQACDEDDNISCCLSSTHLEVDHLIAKKQYQLAFLFNIFYI